jgi:hypothetical protein
MNEPLQDIVEHKVRKAAGANALRRIGKIVDEDRQADEEKARALRWFMRYGWLAILCAALALAYLMGVI